MEIEKLIERLQNWDGIKPDREIDCAIEGLKALQAENDRLQAELEKAEAVRKKQADILYELRGQKYEQITAIDQLRAENERLKRERDAAVESWRGFCSQCAWKNHQYLADGKMDDRCRTCRDNAKCNWKWRGPKEE